MPAYTENHTLPFSPEQMFDLVLDVARYPEFLPWCVSTRVNSHSEVADGPQKGTGTMSADMAIGFTVFRETYTSTVTFERPTAKRPGHIHVVDSHGPFDHLVTDWRFVPADGGCAIHFEIDFAFRSALLEKAIGRVFEDATRKMVGAFVARAGAKYGKGQGT